MFALVTFVVLCSSFEGESLRIAPAARACHSAATTDNGIAIWGGASECGVGVLSDAKLWRWNGTSWLEEPEPPIVPREDALLLSSPFERAPRATKESDVAKARAETLTLIGGRRDGVVHSDVWTFDGDTWIEAKAEGGPGAIEHAAAAFDPVRKRIVVFGGAVGRERATKTHEWDGTRWHAFDVPGPAPRVGHGMAWSKADGGVLLYGGFADDRFRDLWRWDGACWTRLADDGPTFTEGHVISEADEGVYVVGPGIGDAATVRVWKWHGAKFEALGEAGPQNRVGATATYDRTRRALVYWGGSTPRDGASAVVHEFDGERWRELVGE